MTKLDVNYPSRKHRVLRDRLEFDTMTKTFTKPTDVYMVGRIKQDYVLQLPVMVVHRTIRDALIEGLIIRRLQRQL